MSEIKVILNLQIRGIRMLGEQADSKNLRKKGKSQKPLNTNSNNNEVITVDAGRTARKVIKLSREAYDYMTSTECPSPKLKKDWAKFSDIQKLEYHCGKIAEAHKAISFSFKVLDD